ncbi:MAG: hypothetical protein DMG13_29475 [Acidobacteria bacterium]|nr:MAG: hypothetical protein DMG13_29475 [Acidobacteriota bacterium]
MSSNMIRRGPALAFVLAGIVAVSVLTDAQTKTTGPIEHITATSVNVTGAPDPVKIDLLRWSTDAEREQLLSAFAKSEKELAAALEKAPTLGYVWTSESAGYSLRYAYRVQTPAGERLIFATDRRLGSWNPQLWKPVGNAAPSEYPFTLIELRFNRRGEGEGKTSLTAKIAADAQVKTLALDNYTAAPVVMKGAKRENRSGQPSN